jgi:hypothetical protein
MKIFAKALTICLFLGLSFGCAQSQDNGDTMEDDSMEQEEMMEEQMMSSAVKFSKAHTRGNDNTRPSPNAAISQTIGTTHITVTYGRPGVKGRTILGDLVNYDNVWRTGANESTVVTFPTDVTIEGQSLKAGTYSLYTIPDQDEWTIVFNEKISWGTQYDKSKDILRVDVDAESAPSMEQFMIYFQNVTDTSAEAILHWDETKVPFTIEV